VKQWIQKVLVVGLSATFALAVAEFVVRHFDIGPIFSPVVANALRLSDNPRLVYELVPGAKAETQWNAVINRYGMRDREYSLQKPEGTLRICCIGDSISLGWGVSQEDGFPEVMEELLDQPGQKPVEVLNFGVVGYNIEQIVESLRSKALRFDPDVVVYAFCLNDPLDYSFMETKLRSKLDPVQNKLWDALTDTTRHGLAKSHLLMLTRYVVRSWTLGSHDKEAEVDPMQDPAYAAVSTDRYAEYFRGLYRGRGWNRITEGFDELADLTTQRGIPTVIVIFPLFRDLQDYQLTEVHEKIASSASAHGFLVVDLLGPYQKLSSRFGSTHDISMDPVHPNEVGHRLAAVKIVKALENAGFISSSP
jgi:lysophospholipase L1-like esterase